MRAFRVLLFLVVLFAVACVADRPVAPGLFVLDDLGTGRWRTVSAGVEHSCALDLDGRAYCWGSNRYYQLGVDRTDSICGSTPKYGCSLYPTPVATGRQFVSISAGARHTCAVSTDSVPFCWGYNQDGQAGVFRSTSPWLQVVGGLPMVAVNAGSTHSCGVRTDSLVSCWGSNLFGALGNGPGTGVGPVVVGSTLKFAEVDASDQKTCARLVTGKVMCWGTLWVRTSGDTNFTRIRTTPELVDGASTMAGIGVGPNSTCGFDPTGFAWCWDTNVNGESGTGPGPGSIVRRRIRSDEEFHQISVGATHVCGITTDGAALCWGKNNAGQLGFPTSEQCGRALGPCSTRPARVYGRQRFTSVSAGLGLHTCGVTDRHNLYCWGAGSSGQRGDGTRGSRSLIPRLAAVVAQQ